MIIQLTLKLAYWKMKLCNKKNIIWINNKNKRFLKTKIE